MVREQKRSDNKGSLRLCESFQVQVARFISCLSTRPLAIADCSLPIADWSIWCPLGWESDDMVSLTVTMKSVRQRGSARSFSSSLRGPTATALSYRPHCDARTNRQSLGGARSV